MLLMAPSMTQANRSSAALDLGLYSTDLSPTLADETEEQRKKRLAEKNPLSIVSPAVSILFGKGGGE